MESLSCKDVERCVGERGCVVAGTGVDEFAEVLDPREGKGVTAFIEEVKGCRVDFDEETGLLRTGRTREGNRAGARETAEDLTVGLGGIVGAAFDAWNAIPVKTSTGAQCNTSKSGVNCCQANALGRRKQ